MRWHVHAFLGRERERARAKNERKKKNERKRWDGKRNVFLTCSECFNLAEHRCMHRGRKCGILRGNARTRARIL